MFAQRVCFVDVETTGTHPAHDRITEIGVVTVDHDGDARRVTEWSSLVNPGRSIPPQIRWLTGIDDDMVRTAPSFAELAEPLYDLLENALFVAHNARFDFGFIKAEFARAGIASWSARTLCTVRLSRRLQPDRGSHSLDAIAARFGLDDAQRHRALGDARLLWRFTQKLYERLPPAQIEEAVQALLVRPGLPAALGAETLQAIPAAPGVYLMLGASGQALYIGKSVDLKSRVAAHFAGDSVGQHALRLASEVERIEWEATVGEVGALLREAQLIKQRLPAHNVRLRRRLAQGALCLDDGRPRWVGAAELPERFDGAHYGPYGSHAAARKELAELAREHGLCLKAMGLEGRARSAPAGTPCFNFQLRRCRGACVGLESQAAHMQRLGEALAHRCLPAWPHAGAIALIERGPDPAVEAWHVFDRWRWRGSAQGRTAALTLTGQDLPPFDADEFNIIRAALERAAQGELETVDLDTDRRSSSSRRSDARA